MNRNTRRHKLLVGGLLLQAAVFAATAEASAQVNRAPQSVRNLDVMTLRAKEMLAEILHASASDIRVVGLEPRTWADNRLGCPAPEPTPKEPVPGYRLVLEHLGRAYTFSTDLHRVIACPPIEAQ